MIALVAVGLASACANVIGADFGDYTLKGSGGAGGHGAGSTAASGTASHGATSTASAGLGGSGGSGASTSGSASVSGSASSSESSTASASASSSASSAGGCSGCTTPGCCGAVCQTAHSNGVGQSYYDCNPPDTHTLMTAMEACAAYAVTVGGTAADCFDGWGCSAEPSLDQVCYANATGATCMMYCWAYVGAPGSVTTCSACNTSAGTWN